MDELIDKSVVTLQGYLDAIMTAVLSSANDCPPHMRVAFRNLNRRVSEHFNAPEHEVSHFKWLTLQCLLNGYLHDTGMSFRFQYDTYILFHVYTDVLMR